MSESTKKKFYQTDGFRMFMGKYGIGVILIFMILVIGVMKPRFLYPSNILNVLTQISVNCLIAYGMCLCITTGGIDLSVGPQLALVSVLLGQFIVVRGMNIGLSVVLAVLAATVFGFVNGFLVAKFDMACIRCNVGDTVGYPIDCTDHLRWTGNVYGIPAFKNIYSGTLAGIPYPIIYMVVASIIMYIVMHWTKFGRYVFAVGGNVNAAIASGVNVFWTKTLCYTISGLLAGIAGVIFTSKTGSAQSNIGVAYETDAVAACVLGGTSFAGGIATAPGVLLGAVIIGCIYNGMNFLNIGSYYQYMTKGIIIILAVLLDMVINKKNR